MLETVTNMFPGKPRKGSQPKAAKPKEPKDVSTDVRAESAPFLRWMAAKTFSGPARASLYNRLAFAVRGGVPIKRAIETLYQREAFKSDSETLAVILRTVMLKLNAGQTLSEGLQPYIPLNELMIIKSGEATDLAGSFERAASTVTAVQGIKRKIRDALMKPLIISVVLVIALTTIGKLVIPKLEGTLPADSWTGPAKALALMSNWATGLGMPITVAVGLIGMIMIQVSLKRWAGRSRILFDRLPPWSLYRMLQGAGWLITLSSLLQTGRPIKYALNDLLYLANRDGNRYIAVRTLAVIRENESGAVNIGEAMEQTKMHFPDRDVISDIVMMATLKDFNAQVGKLSMLWIKQSEERVERFSSLMNLVSYSALGVFMFAFVMGVVSLNQQITSSMGA